MFEFWREARAASVPGLLCQSGRRRPENKHAVCGTDSQCKSTSLPKKLATILLCEGNFRSRARQGKRSSLSPMFILEHQRKTDFCRLFFNNTKYFFFVIPKVCWTVCVFHFLNLESLKRIYASLFTFRDFRHRRTMILKVERTLKHAKTMERNSTTCECIFHQLAVKNVNVNVVKTIYCQP